MANTFESIAWLKQQLGSGCEEMPVQGDRPLLLDDPSCAYVILSEHHQLFCVGYDRGRPLGRREHMATCQPGQLLFGLEPAPGLDSTALMLSGVSGSVVWRIPTALLFRLTEHADGQAVIGRLFDAWIELLGNTLPVTPVPTRCAVLQAGTMAALDGSLPVRAESGLLWLAPKTPPRLYRNLAPSGKGLRAECWPLTEQAWALFDEDSVRVWHSADLLRVSHSASFAEGFYAFVVAVVSQRRADLASTRLRRDDDSRGAERRFVAESLARLAAVGRGERLPPRIEGDDFARTCHVLAHFLNVESPRVVPPQGSSLSHMQMALSRMTGIRTRGVLLEGSWPKHDNGALLAFRLLDAEETGVLHPVALLPERGGYRIVDSSADGPRVLDRETANQLHPQAYQFYAPLGGQPLGIRDVLRFSSSRARSDLLLAVLLGIGAGSLGTLIPLLTGQVFDRIIPGAERNLLRQLTAVILAVYLGRMLLDLARGLLLVRAQTRMDARLEAGVWDRLLNLPLPFFRRYSAGDLAARMAGIGGIRELLAGATLSALLGGVFSLWNFGLLFYIDPRLAALASALVGVSGLVALVASYYALKRQRAVADLDGKIGGLLLQLFTGMPKLRVTGAENRVFGVWARLFAARRDADLGAELVNIRVAVFQSGYPMLCGMALFWMLAGQTTEKLSTGQFLAFSAAFGSFMAAVSAVIETGLHTLNVIPMYERAKPILTEGVESQGSGEARIELKGSIELSHVTFRYEAHGPLILDDVNVRVEPNEFVAIVGPSGSGKSTLLRILLGFETPTEGSVFYDGQALSGLDVRVVRQQIGVVLQNSRVMAGDIYANIAGNSGLSLEAARRAAKQAAFDKDIDAMPMGIHTVIEQSGGTLSGGQRQRLLIARALAGEPCILLFDEATSALDNLTQAAVSESLEALRVTRVVIAHRLSTIRHADKIIVLERGRVVECGRFEELMAKGGLFRALASRQMV